MDDTIDCCLALKIEELVEIVPDVTPTAYEKGDVELLKYPVNGLIDDLIAVEVVVIKVNMDLLLDGVAHSEYVPASEVSLNFVLVPVRANIATTATNECIISTNDEGTCPSLDHMMLQDPVDGIAKDETALGKNYHGDGFNANENGLYRNLHASEVSIVKGSNDSWTWEWYRMSNR